MKCVPIVLLVIFAALLVCESAAERSNRHFRRGADGASLAPRQSRAVASSPRLTGSNPEKTMEIADSHRILRSARDLASDKAHSMGSKYGRSLHATYVPLSRISEACSPYLSFMTMLLCFCAMSLHVSSPANRIEPLISS